MAAVASSPSTISTCNTLPPPLSEKSENNNNAGYNKDFNYKKGIKDLVETSTDLMKLPSEFVMNLPANPLSVPNSYDIPVIDLSGIDGEHRASIVKDLSSACEEWGFFRIVNHGIETSLIEELLEEVQKFFNLSVEEKMKYASGDVTAPVRFGTSLNSSSSKQALHWRDYLRIHGVPFKNSMHLWPDNPPNYRNVTKKYLTEMWTLAMRMLGAISEGLGLEESYTENGMGEGFQVLVANYYPACPEPEKTLGLAAHSDHGALTILMQNGVGGLQVQHKDQWVAVPHVPGTLVVNLGDFLEILSNGKYKSVMHRAVVNSTQTRMSFAAVHGPQASTVIGPAPQLISKDGTSKYQRIKYSDYIKLQQESPIRGKTVNGIKT